MTPAAFAKKYRPTAEQVSRGTGIDPIALLAQWANETAWGTRVFGNNLGNIRCSPTTFCSFATLSDFADGCIGTFHNGFYAKVLAATTADTQLAAIVASPWSAGHYGDSLDAFYQPLEGLEMTPAQAQQLKETDAKVNEIWNLVRTGFHATGNPRWIFTELEAIKAKIDGLVVSAGGGLTNAQAQTLTAAAADIAAVRVRVERDLA